MRFHVDVRELPLFPLFISHVTRLGINTDTPALVLDDDNGSLPSVTLEIDENCHKFTSFDIVDSSEHTLFPLYSLHISRVKKSRELVNYAKRKEEPSLGLLFCVVIVSSINKIQQQRKQSNSYDAAQRKYASCNQFFVNASICSLRLDNISITSFVI